MKYLALLAPLMLMSTMALADGPVETAEAAPTEEAAKGEKATKAQMEKRAENAEQGEKAEKVAQNKADLRAELREGLAESEDALVFNPKHWDAKMVGNIVVLKRKKKKAGVPEVVGVTCNCSVAGSACSTGLENSNSVTCNGAECCSFKVMSGDILKKALETQR